MKRKVLVIASVFFIVLVLSVAFIQNDINSSQSEIEFNSEVELRNSAKKNIHVSSLTSNGNTSDLFFTKVPDRVIVDRMDNLETMLQFGIEDKIVLASVREENSSYKNLEKKYGSRLTGIPGIHYQDFDLETALYANPDLILGWRSTFSRARLRDTDWWKSRGINAYIVSTSNHSLPVSTVEDELKYLSDMGKIFSKEEIVNNYTSQVHNELQYINQARSGLPGPTVAVIEFNGRKIINYDKTWLIGDMVTRMGGSMPISARSISIEDLLYYNPDVIFVIYLKDDQLQDRKNRMNQPEFSSLNAVKNKRINYILLDYIYSPGFKTLDGIRMIKDGLYPALPSIWG